MELEKQETTIFSGAARNKFFEAHHDGALRRREAGPLDVGAVAEEREHAFLSVAREGVQVERLSVDRRGVHFEIAGVNDDSDGRANRERDAINGAVRDVQIFDLKRADRR